MIPGGFGPHPLNEVPPMSLMLGGPLDGQRIEVNPSAARYYSHGHVYDRANLAVSSDDAVVLYVHSEETRPLSKLVEGYPKQGTQL